MNKHNDIKHDIAVEETSYFTRVLNHDALKKGTAAFIASVLFSAVSEALFPTNES